MHLLRLLQINMEDLELQMFEQDDFPIEMEKRSVNQLQERYEVKNTRNLIDVNMGENDIVEDKIQSQDTEQQKIKLKMIQVDETIKTLKQRKIEAQVKFEFLNAPKRAEQKKKLDQKNNGDKKKK